MSYSDLLSLYKNNRFREIDESPDAQKFYLLRSISKKNTLRDFSRKHSLQDNLDDILSNNVITVEKIIEYIRETFVPKTETEISDIEAELNKMQNFDWGGSAGNSLEKNIVNNVVKKNLKYDDVQRAIAGPIQHSVYGYTLNSWYNHWSSILIQEIFYANPKVIPTIDLVEKIDFFIEGTPFDLKVTYFPEELMEKKIAPRLQEEFGRRNELTCMKKIAREIGISIPADLERRALTICLHNLLCESTSEIAQDFLVKLSEIKSEVYDYYVMHPNELIVWLYENQGERRFDAANRFYVVLIDRDKPFDSWKLKRNVRLLKDKINEKIDEFDENQRNCVKFHWENDEKDYSCYSEILFISR